MKTLLATAALLLATATASFAGWSESNGPDQFTGSTTYRARVEGTVNNASWYNVKDASLAIACTGHPEKALGMTVKRPVSVTIHVGDEVIAWGGVSDNVVVGVNVDGTFLGNVNASTGFGFVQIVPQLTKKGFVRNSMIGDIYAADGGSTITFRIPTFQGFVDAVFNAAGFREVFQKAAWDCGHNIQ